MVSLRPTWLPIRPCTLFLVDLVWNLVLRITRANKEGTHSKLKHFGSPHHIWSRACPSPGISDYEHPLIIRCKCKVRQNKKKSRYIHFCKKANWENAKTHSKDVWESFFNEARENHSVTTNWAYFKDTKWATINKCIPCKNIFGKIQPTMSTFEINKLMQKRQRSYINKPAEIKQGSWLVALHNYKERKSGRPA